jgi:hypothetical protein
LDVEKVSVIIYYCAEFCQHLVSYPVPPGVRVLTLPQDGFGLDPHLYQENLGETEVVAQANYCMFGSDEDLHRLLRTPGIPQDVSFTSVIWYLAPWTHKWIQEHATLLPYAALCKTLAVTMIDLPKEPKRVCDSSFRQLTSVALLGPGFSTPDLLLKQVFKRGAAASQTIGSEFGTEADFLNFMSRYPYKARVRTGFMDNCLGRCLAVNSYGEYNPLFHKDELIDLATSDLAKGMTPWGKALYEQARMVYERSHAQSLNFAMDVFNLVIPIIQHLGMKWHKEAEALEKVAREIRDAPFSGLISPLPAHRQINQMA